MGGNLLCAAAAMTLLAGPALGRTRIAVSMARFDGKLLTDLRDAMAAEASALGDVDVRFEDAQGDIGRQLSQFETAVAEKADAVIVDPVDTSVTPKTTKRATDAHVPLVYVSRKPVEQTLPPGVAFVGSDETQSGTLEAEELAKLMNYHGNVAIMQGDPATDATTLRTQDVEAVVAKYPGMKVVRKQVANFQRDDATDLMNQWIIAGERIDAVAANNDEMAIGALIAMDQAGVPPHTVLVGGIDASPDALAEMDRGRLAVTVFQDARAEGKGAIDTAVKLARGEPGARV